MASEYVTALDHAAYDVFEQYNLIVFLRLCQRLGIRGHWDFLAVRVLHHGYDFESRVVGIPAVLAAPFLSNCCSFHNFLKYQLTFVLQRLCLDRSYNVDLVYRREIW